MINVFHLRELRRMVITKTKVNKLSEKLNQAKNMLDVESIKYLTVHNNNRHKAYRGMLNTELRKNEQINGIIMILSIAIIKMIRRNVGHSLNK